MAILEVPVVLWLATVGFPLLQSDFLRKDTDTGTRVAIPKRRAQQGTVQYCKCRTSPRKKRHVKNLILVRRVHRVLAVVSRTSNLPYPITRERN